MTHNRASGTLWIHSCSRALTGHVEWALDRVLPVGDGLPWRAQVALPGRVRAHVGWRGPSGAAAGIASILGGFDLRFEVTESAGEDALGERFAYVPHLGMFRATAACGAGGVVRRGGAGDGRGGRPAARGAVGPRAGGVPRRSAGRVGAVVERDGVRGRGSHRGDRRT